MREHAYVWSIECNYCGRSFRDDCGDSFCSSSCEREWNEEHVCTNCEGEFEELCDGLCADCENMEEEN